MSLCDSIKYCMCYLVPYVMNFSIPSFCAAGTGKLALMIGLLLQKLRWIVAQVSVKLLTWYILVLNCPLAHFLLQPSAY